MERRLEKIMRAICACALALSVTGCVETAQELAISEPDPELNFVRGYRSVADECQLVGETAFTGDLLDDSADLVACPTGSAAMASLMAETGAPVITQTNSFSFFSIPYR
ncbi:hypothetical protein [Ruegeria arenilitoris]|uniref:Uncharacterized protein n=1 Tax=Ruegeria arenilitoris TaxID=1173585 RepID=A0A238L125_9RHOB|nr:hypothetical protein [Ruegeria arenilitoris]MBY6082785.1 hypothetical protein [Ruegeria arenilitoris]SMX48521.1 hypothetical protein RUA8715_03507 [Ruegeria arenilitoris]